MYTVKVYTVHVQSVHGTFGEEYHIHQDKISITLSVTSHHLPKMTYNCNFVPFTYFFPHIFGEPITRIDSWHSTVLGNHII